VACCDFLGCSVYNPGMTASAKPREPKPRPALQFFVDEQGNKTAVLVPLEIWERVAPLLQNDLERALMGEPVEEDVPPHIAKRLRDHAKGKKEEMLTLEEFKAEVERLRHD
jgi:hypothetical protein